MVIEFRFQNLNKLVFVFVSMKRVVLITSVIGVILVCLFLIYYILSFVVNSEEDDCLVEEGYFWCEHTEQCLEVGDETCPDACIDLGCDDDAIYVGSINSNKFYKCNCHYANRIKKENIFCFRSDMEAKMNGYVESEC